MATAHSYLQKHQQHVAELAKFVDFVRNSKIESYLEIGSKFGGALWAVSNVLPKGARIVSVDLPNGHWGRSDSELSLRNCIDQLKRRGFDAHLFLGDSTAQPIIEAVQKLAPFDCVFIDANHTELYVRKDFAHYGKLGKYCCFHDIAWNNPTPPKRIPIEVPKVWKEFKELYRNEAEIQEIKCDVNHNGIGIIYWKQA